MSRAYRKWHEPPTRFEMQMNRIGECMIELDGLLEHALQQEAELGNPQQPFQMQAQQDQWLLHRKYRTQRFLNSQDYRGLRMHHFTETELS